MGCVLTIKIAGEHPKIPDMVHPTHKLPKTTLKQEHKHKQTISRFPITDLIIIE